MKYHLLTELIGHLENYQQENRSNKIEDFIIWLNNQLFKEEKPENESNHDELLIAFKLMSVYKELKRGTKRILASSKLSSIDEYSFLLHLNHQNSFRKMELVDMHHLEAPTGIEIIKRLLKNTFIEEFPDQEDRRAKRIKITKKGIDQLQIVQPHIEKLFYEFAKPLQLPQKIMMSGFLDLLMK